MINQIINDVKQKKEDDEVHSLLNKQVSNEIKNALFYQLAQNWCNTNGFLKAAKFFEKQSADEISHSLRILHFIQDRDICFTNYEIGTINETFVSLLDVVDKSISKEKMTTESLSKILHCAEEYDKPLIKTFMLEMLKEQQEEEGLFRDLWAVGKQLDPNNKYQMLFFEKSFK